MPNDVLAIERISKCGECRIFADAQDSNVDPVTHWMDLLDYHFDGHPQA